MPDTFPRTILRPALLVGALVVLSSCSWFGKQERQTIPVDQRATLALLPARLDTTVDKASQVETLAVEVSSEEDRQRAAAAVEAIQAEAHRIFLEAIEAGDQFRLIPTEDIEAVAQEIGFDRDKPMTREQFLLFRDRLQADLVVQPTVLDYGKLRWSWLAKGMLADTTWQTLLFRLAFAWNPAILLGNVGLEAAGWLGGGYVFAVASKPVRVEATAWDPINGKAVWKEEEAALFVWRRLHQLPEAERKKKEAQLYLNLKQAMRGLADSLLNEGLTIPKLKLRHPSPLADLPQTAQEDCIDEPVGMDDRTLARPAFALRGPRHVQEVCEPFGL
jgi:hypothetical protein